MFSNIAPIIEVLNPNLEYLNVAFTGLDHVPLKYIKENNIYLTNASGYSTISVSEQVIGMTLALYRKLHLNDFITKSNKDSSILGPGEEIHNKTVNARIADGNHFKCGNDKRYYNARGGAEEHCGDKYYGVLGVKGQKAYMDTEYKLAGVCQRAKYGDNDHADQFFSASSGVMHNIIPF